MVGGADTGRMKDENGEVQPANWTEGDNTIRGDSIAKLDSFAAADGQHVNGKANCTKRFRVDWQKPTCPWRMGDRMSH